MKQTDKDTKKGRKALRIPKKHSNTIISDRIRLLLIRVQKVLDKQFLNNLGSLKMSALTSCKERLSKALIYSKSYERHIKNEEVLSNDKNI